jgi:L-lactate dehydrogenase
MEKGKKIVVLGAGNVGATIAYTLTVKGLASEIVLVDINKERAEGEAMDIIQGTALCPPVNIHAGDYADAADADIVVVTVGMARRPGQTRIDLAQANVNIIKSVMPQITAVSPNALYVVVSNPVDVLTYAIKKITGLPESQVIGSGTLLDTSRLRSRIADSVNINPQNVHAYMLGEHGDTSVVPWSATTIGGINIREFKKIYPELESKIDFDAIADDVRTAGARIIERKGATFYSIALSVARICSCLLKDTHTILPVSGTITGQYGITDVCLSIPFAINSQGLLYPMPPLMTPEEEEKMRASANALKEVISSLDI